MEVAMDGRVERIEVTAKSQKFELAAEKAPASVVLDPNTWVLMDARQGK
jgi:hypothetical protein